MNKYLEKIAKKKAHPIIRTEARALGAAGPIFLAHSKGMTNPAALAALGILGSTAADKVVDFEVEHRRHHRKNK